MFYSNSKNSLSSQLFLPIKITTFVFAHINIFLAEFYPYWNTYSKEDELHRQKLLMCRILIRIQFRQTGGNSKLTVAPFNQLLMPSVVKSLNNLNFLVMRNKAIISSLGKLLKWSRWSNDFCLLLLISVLETMCNSHVIRGYLDYHINCF